MDAVGVANAPLGTDCRGRGCDGWYEDIVQGTRRVNDHVAELRVKTVKYFKSIERVQEEVESSREKPAKKEGDELVGV